MFKVRRLNLSLKRKGRSEPTHSAVTRRFYTSETNTLNHEEETCGRKV